MLNMSWTESLNEKTAGSIFLWAYIFLNSSFKANELAFYHYIGLLCLTSPLERIKSVVLKCLGLKTQTLKITKDLKYSLCGLPINHYYIRN